MAVKFEFTLNDRDASNLIDIIQDAATRALQEGQKFIKQDMTRVDRANLDWYTGHADYLEGLKKKILAGNKLVD